MEGFNSVAVRDVEEDLRFDGPVGVLSTRPVSPVTDLPASCYWPAKHIHVFNLITKYVDWCSEDNGDGRLENIKTDLTMKAIQLTAMGVIHSNLCDDRKNRARIGGNNNLADSIYPANIASMGSQL